MIEAPFIIEEKIVEDIPKSFNVKLYAIVLSVMMILIGYISYISDSSSENDLHVSGNDLPTLNEWDVYYVDSDSDLPNCGVETLGRLYYIVSDVTFRACTDTGWIAVDLTGPMGPTGADGLGGMNGTDGADGLGGMNGTDGADGTNGTSGPSALAVTSTEPSGTNCADGGIKIEVGVDDNDDGSLQASEIDQNTYVCDGGNGADGTNGSASDSTMLTSISTPTLTACDAGGRIMMQGLDNGNGGGNAQNGILETGEVDYTTTYCSNYHIGMVKDINSAGSSSPIGFTAVGNALYFQATHDTNGKELWKSDGTTSGTVMVKDINPGTGNSGIPFHLTAVGNTLYFQANDGTNGTELWKSDGTTSGTVMVKDIYPGTGNSSNPSYLKAVGNTLYFRANDGTNGSELWKSDGTSTGTVMVKDIYPGTGNSGFPSYLTAVGNTLYFQANDGISGFELLMMDINHEIIYS